MKSSPKRTLVRFAIVGGLVLLAGYLMRGAAEWKSVVAGSATEAALYRWMPMPGGKVLGPRPPHEAVQLLSNVIQQQPLAELYSLRAMNEEAALDFTAAEADWKKNVESSKSRIAAELALADFYARRLQIKEEIATLEIVAKLPATPAEKLQSVTQQQSWTAFERMLRVVQENALPNSTSDQIYRAWIARYPNQESVYARYFQFLLDGKNFDAAAGLVSQYRSAFPKDGVFPIKAQALLAYKHGSVEQGLHIYEANFEPLWPPELIQSYFDLLTETGSLRKYLDSAKAAQERNPDDLKAAARIYYYYQHQGRTEAAQQALDEYRHRKEQRNAKWTNDELYVLARLSEQLHSYPEGARYYYALYSNGADGPGQKKALAGLAEILLDSPDSGIRLGAGELSMYKDVGSMDQGPGFLNGILSLILNSTQPQYKYSEEEQRAVPYFHRAEAAELIRLLDARFPNSEDRPTLHARLLETYSNYGQSDAVIRDGKQFLAAFPNAPEREQGALLLAYAYERTHRPEDEFALYDSLLTELGKQADNVPLGAQDQNSHNPPPQDKHYRPSAAEAEEQSEANDQAGEAAQNQRAFRVGNISPQTQASGPRSPEYSRVLERYLARLVSSNQLPRALTVLRKEIDRNPSDPGLYERLAEFLGQNRLGEEQEQVYQRAIQQFQDAGWYHKLARFYLREKRASDFEKLSKQVVDIFSGTELDQYFQQEVYPRRAVPDYYYELNQYANARFPHDLVFVRNLLYRQPYCTQSWLKIIEQHWWESEDLRNEYFGCLARSDRLDEVLASLRQDSESTKWSATAADNAVATHFIGEAEIWRCHFEESAAPMGALAKEFPADDDIGRRAAAVYRSLAAFVPADTDTAVAIEENLYRADPGDRDQLAHIGDVLADRELFERAGPYWERMTQVRPGEPGAYLDPATVFWDYYNFKDALRLLNEGRSKLHNPALYSYEEGAIYENQRDYPQAVAEYLHGALQGGDARSRNRLIELARRPKLRDVTDAATASLTAGDAPDLEAVKLRVDILDAQNRAKDIEQLLSSLTSRTNSLELLEWMEQTSQQKSLVTVQQAVLEREAAVTADPVRRLELRYSLVRFYEQRKDLAAAQRNIDALYRENPKIMGVVRSTVDFYWRNKERQRAIEVLIQASNDSYPELRKRFQFETARKQTDAGQYEAAQKVLQSLLKDSPYNDEYLAAMADMYARSGDDQGLKAFYLTEIDAFKSAQLAQDERNHEIATLRRGIIPALTRLKDYAGAVDQYIEIINKYPEDDGLVSEAALYAQKHQLEQKLVTFYSNTVKQSPRDYRWAMVLARTYAQLEEYSQAIDAYATAIRVRPDRTDLRASRADLLERLMRFDDAAAEYRQLFDLNYHDTQWMEKVAAIRARQQKSAETVAALEAALIANRPEKAENYFEVARRLESWGMLQQAREYAQKGVDAAGRDLLAASEHRAGAELYVRIMTRLRQQDAAYQRLQKGISDADSLASSVKVVAEQAEKGGIVTVTDNRWREVAIVARKDAARAGMAACMSEMGSTVARYFAPEEKGSFVSTLQNWTTGRSDDDLAVLFRPAAEAADLPELETQWLQRLLLSHYSVRNNHSYESRLVDLEMRRLHLDQLGGFLERYAKTLSMNEGRFNILVQAAHAYHDGGEDDKELAVLSQMEFTLGEEDQQRLFALLLQKRPEELMRLIQRAEDGLSDQATQYAIEHGSEEKALQAVAARGQALNPVWTKSYDALTGLYFGDRTASTQLAFVSALGDGTIEERLAKPPDRTQQLAGNIWYYYGTRYGVWLDSSKSGDAEDFLPAILEQSPASVEGYITTAEYYAESGNSERAIQDYRRALELASDRPDVHDRIAVLYWKQQKRADAMAEWKKSLELLDEEVRLRSLPPQFWTNLSTVLNHLGSRKLMSQMHDQADTVLRDYIRKNGEYSVDKILRSAFEATGDSKAATAWMLELAAAAPDPNSVLNLLARARWIPVSAKDPIYLQKIARLQERARTADGVEKEYADQELRRWQMIYVRYLIGEKQFDRAAELLDSLPKPESLSANELELRLRIAIARNQLDSALEQYRTVPEQAPDSTTLRTAATAIQRAGMRNEARKIFEYLFAQDIAARNLTPANMLGLAEIRLQDGDVSGAMDLLRRLTLVVGQPFENLDPAASLLARTGHHAEAAQFFAQLVQAEPWNTDVRLQLAQERIAAGGDSAEAYKSARAIDADAQTSYAERVRAAGILDVESASLGSAELDWLAHQKSSAIEAADKAFFYPARLKAAERATPEVRVRLLMNAITQSQDADSARLPLFFALAATGQARLAITAIDPLVSAGLLQSSQARPTYVENQPESEGENEDEGASGGNQPGSAVLVRGSLSVEERAKIAATLADAHNKLQEFDAAYQYYRLAARLETSKTRKAELVKQRNQANAIVRRTAANKLRAPDIHKELDQNHLVAPRLTASASPETGSSKGGKL